jgi:hypothetical protein
MTTPVSVFVRPAAASPLALALARVTEENQGGGKPTGSGFNSFVGGGFNSFVGTAE